MLNKGPYNTDLYFFTHFRIVSQSWSNDLLIQRVLHRITAS